MASFLKKTTFAKPEVNTSATTASKLGSGLGKKTPAPLKTGLNKGPAQKPPLGGSLLKKKAEPKEVDLETEVKEEIKTEEKIKPGNKPKLGGVKKSLSMNLKDNVITEDKLAPEIKTAKEELKNMGEKQDIHTNENGEVFINAATVEVKEETPPVEEKKTSKKKTSKKSTKAKKEEKTEQQILKAVEIDETKKVPLEQIDQIMRPIVAPTTELWEQEKKDVLEALNNIKVEQDMNMTQVKSCLSELDELKFEILPKQHDAETMYDGTKQNYDTVKAVAIANGSGANSEARKAEGILACQNFATPTGEIVDLHQYMLLIEERYKFYEKVSNGVNFKKYSLVNYNNAIKAEKEGK